MTKTCFVVMGFNEKTDPITGRVLDLDKTYRGIIKPAATDAGYECFRADEVQHSGIIDVPMYRALLEADLVIADLSTLNPNAFFELGVRYALRSRKTIVIAEEGFVNPFDTNHISMRFYRHDGKALDFEVVETFKAELLQLIKQVDSKEEDDSPVYTFLEELKTPETEKPELVQNLEEQAVEALNDAYSVLIERALAFRAEKKFNEMAGILEGIRLAQGEDAEPFVIHQLALAYYKSEFPTQKGGLEKAISVLEELNPTSALDSETIGLWGAVQKRLAELDEIDEAARVSALDEAIDALSRGFYLLHDYYNGINAAYMLDLRASMHRPEDPEAIADRIIAQRIRLAVLNITKNLLKNPVAGESPAKRIENAYWIEATRVEALFGLDRKDEAKVLFQELQARQDIEAWMTDSTKTQLDKLEKIL